MRKSFRLVIAVLVMLLLAGAMAYGDDGEDHSGPGGGAVAGDSSGEAAPEGLPAPGGDTLPAAEDNIAGLQARADALLAKLDYPGFYDYDELESEIEQLIKEIEKLKAEIENKEAVEIVNTVGDTGFTAGNREAYRLVDGKAVERVTGVSGYRFEGGRWVKGEEKEDGEEAARGDREEVIVVSARETAKEEGLAWYWWVLIIIVAIIIVPKLIGIISSASTTKGSRTRKAVGSMVGFLMNVLRKLKSWKRQKEIVKIEINASEMAANGEEESEEVYTDAAECEEADEGEAKDENTGGGDNNEGGDETAIAAEERTAPVSEVGKETNVEIPKQMTPPQIDIQKYVDEEKRSIDEKNNMKDLLIYTYNTFLSRELHEIKTNFLKLEGITNDLNRLKSQIVLAVLENDIGKFNRFKNGETVDLQVSNKINVKNHLDNVIFSTMFSQIGKLKQEDDDDTLKLIRKGLQDVTRYLYDKMLKLVKDNERWP